MLKRVGNALAKFIAPIATSTQLTGGEVKTRPDPKDFKPFQKKKENPQENPEKEDTASLQPEAESHDEPTLESSSKEETPTPPNANPPIALEHGFVQLMNRLQGQKEKIFNLTGKRQYTEKKGSQKKTVKVRKGAMINRKVE